MSGRIKVLIVDDSTVIRRLLTDALSSDPAIEVVGIAANGKIALAKIPQLNPDIITLDIEMPEMHGLATLVELRKLYPKLPVIMFSTLTRRGAEATMEALAKGATDYVTKPANVGSVTVAIQSVRNEMIPRIKAFCLGIVAALPSGHAAGPAASGQVAARSLSSFVRTNTLTRLRSNGHIAIVAIGVSTGGPNALQALIPMLPESLSVPIVIVQHMPPIFTKHLADRLNQLSPLHVQEAKDGDLVQPGVVLIAPGDFHMITQRKGNAIRMALNKGTPENSCRPAVDVLFRSVAEVYRSNALAVVLTGMGQDGARGCGVIRDKGGRTIAQDEATSVVWGMPGTVVQSGFADKVLPLNRIADEIIRETQLSRSTRTLIGPGS